jgi:predicted dienelactone hydrolase
MTRTLLALTALSLLCAGCPSEPDPEPEPDLSTPSIPDDGDPWADGPFVPAHVTATLVDEARDRTLTVEIWYPVFSDALLDAGAPVSHFEPEGERAGVEALLAAAPEGCPTRQTDAARGVSAMEVLGPRPLVAYSHCLNCGRYSNFTVAERLASHGFVVVAPDHAGPRPFVEGSPGETLSPGQLTTRVADMGAVLDAALDGSLFEGIDAVAQLEVDADAVGVMGHSFGSATAGFVAHDDPRVKAAAGLAAPMANPLFRGATMPGIEVPVMLVVAQEDNSIGEAGNAQMRTNYDDANAPAWRVEIEDAGHWSVSDFAGLTDAFMPGCGMGERHSEARAGEAFTYLPAARGVELTARHVTTFFLAHLTDHEQAAQTLAALPAEDGVEVLSK